MKTILLSFLLIAAPFSGVAQSPGLIPGNKGVYASGPVFTIGSPSLTLYLPITYAPVDVTNNYNVTGAESIIRAWGTNQLITNSVTGQLLTVKSMGYGGSVIITNNGTVFDVPGVGTMTNAIYLGARNSPSNMWTGLE